MKITAAIMVLLAGIGLIAFAFDGWNRGRIGYKIVVTARDEAPIWFRMQLCMWTVIGLGLVVVGIKALLEW